MKIKLQTKITLTVFFLILIISIQSIFASEKNIFTLGGKEGWSLVTDRRNITTTSGRYGLQALEVDDTGGIVNAETDLFFDFESNSIYDLTGNYTIISDESERAYDSIRGKRYASFNENRDGIKILGVPNSMLGSSGLVGSFTIGFWLNPFAVNSGEILFFWDSSRDLDKYTIYQMMIVEIQNSVLMWNFSNIFDFTKDKQELRDIVNLSHDVVLTGNSTLVPRKWAYHQISFDETTGLLEYTVDGIVEDLCYVTSTGDERGEVCLPYLGLPTKLDIAPNFFGGLDDLSITKACLEESASTGKYIKTGGRFVSEPLYLSEFGATINEFNAIESVPSETEIEYFIRFADDFYNWTEDYPKWQPVNNGDQLKLSGKVFQVAADLYPNGGGTVSPSVTEISLNFTENEPPLPPYRVEAVAGNGCVTLNWATSSGITTDGILGYNIYYGEKSGEYLGVTAMNGDSPIRVFSSDCTYTIKGLQNGQIYYFAISAFSQDNPKLEGELSKEVYARPSSRL